MRITVAQAALPTFLLIAACSSRNPDALVSANVELNQPAAEANAELNDLSTQTASAAPAPVANAPASKSDPQVDDTVNKLKSMDAEDNEVSAAEDQFNRENEEQDPQ